MMQPEESKAIRILIVDDEPDVEMLIRQRFKRRNGDFDFVFARNGQEALEALEKDPTLEMVVTDINMPVMDGLALLNRLNALSGRIVKAVILSAYGDMANIRSAMNRGAFDFLTKPIDFRDFETTLRRTLEALVATRQGMVAREQLTAIEQELEIAARIQSSMLRQDFDFQERDDFAVYAEMTPARHVGGDFYDFFSIDEQRLGFVIGDVAGKGIPAALFMAVSRTLIQAVALQNNPPATCFEYANRVLGAQGEPGVYVTAFYGILHTDSGEVEYCLGGHNPPYRISNAGEIGGIEEPAGAVIGLLPDGGYENGRLTLEPGESIIMFTDGITEAMNAEEKFFGERRLRKVLSGAAGRSLRDTVSAVNSAVAEFTAGAPQSDDMTLLAVRWTPQVVK